MSHLLMEHLIDGIPYTCHNSSIFIYKCILNELALNFINNNSLTSQGKFMDILDDL